MIADAKKIEMGFPAHFLHNKKSVIINLRLSGSSLDPVQLTRVPTAKISFTQVNNTTIKVEDGTTVYALLLLGENYNLSLRLTQTG